MKRSCFNPLPVSIFLLLMCTSCSLAFAQTLTGRVYNWSAKRNGDSSTKGIIPILKGSTRDLASLEIFVKTLSAGETYQMKSDENIERLIIVEAGLLKFAERDKQVGKGSIAWIVPGDKADIQSMGGPSAFYVLQYRSISQKNDERGNNAGGSFIIDWKDVQVKPTDKGERREFFDRATSMFERFEMHVTTLNKKDEVSHAPHTHRAEEIVLLISGTVEMQIGEEHIKAYPGAVVFLASEVPHALKNVGDAPCTYFAFQWQEKK